MRGSGALVPLCCVSTEKGRCFCLGRWEDGNTRRWTLRLLGEGVQRESARLVPGSQAAPCDWGREARLKGTAWRPLVRRGLMTSGHWGARNGFRQS